ncbi:uncharacterized protein LOC119111482, partial [Pollicipes pollicipes]|uniref:uncharacterized protein LOC119111482 n=1 Tax=Pollicipes pollicipes TaxID=41117 RepID=UPI0018852AD4
MSEDQSAAAAAAGGGSGGGADRARPPGDMLAISVAIPDAAASELDSASTTPAGDEGDPFHQPVGHLSPGALRRGPGRPRKDTVSPVDQRRTIGLKLKRLSSGTYVRGVPRGPRGRRKSDLPSPLPGSVADPWGDNSRDAEDDCSDTSSVQSSLDRSASLDESLVFQERWPGKVCALCNLGERSILGQGDMRCVPGTAGAG